MKDFFQAVLVASVVGWAIYFLLLAFGVSLGISLLLSGIAAFFAGYYFSSHSS